MGSISLNTCILLLFLCLYYLHSLILSQNSLRCYYYSTSWATIQLYSMDSFTNHVFGTLTYSRDISISDCGERISKDFNRYIQKFRRLHNTKVQYIRAIEAHADGYPHIHVILQFPTSLRVNDSRYFDRELFKKWKQLWTSGVADYRPPNTKRQPVLYLVKYISKNTSAYRTLWKKLLPANTVEPSNGLTQTVTKNVSDVKPSSDDIKFVGTLLFCKTYKLRQLSWSRNFTFPVLPMACRPEAGQTSLNTSVPK